MKKKLGMAPLYLLSAGVHLALLAGLTALARTDSAPGSLRFRVRIESESRAGERGPREEMAPLPPTADFSPKGESAPRPAPRPAPAAPDPLPRAAAPPAEVKIKARAPSALPRRVALSRPPPRKVKMGRTAPAPLSPSGGEKNKSARKPRGPDPIAGRKTNPAPSPPAEVPAPSAAEAPPPPPPPREDERAAPARPPGDSRLEPEVSRPAPPRKPPPPRKTRLARPARPAQPARPARPAGEAPPSREELAARISEIRRRIEEARIYPENARAGGIEGTAVVAFRILPDGRLGPVRLRKSSGHPALDGSSLETVRRAAPLPYVKGVIVLPIRYRLNEVD